MVDASAANVGQVAQSLLPSFSANVIVYIVIIVIVLGLLGWGFYWLLKKQKFNLTFVIYKDVSGKPTVVDRCKGIEMILGKTGEKCFFIPKYAKYLPSGSLQMGIRTYYYYIDKASNWHNFDIDRIDVGKREPQLNMQQNMDYARDGINKRLEDKHNKDSWLSKYGMVLVSVIVIAVLLVFIWLAFKDALANNQAAQSNLQISQKIQQDLTIKYTNLLVAMENVCSGQHINASSIINGTEQVPGLG